MFAIPRFVSACQAVLLVSGLMVFAPSWAQTWPTKPVKLIVPYAAGGPADAMARQIANKMQSLTGQSVVVDIRTGAGGTIGVDATVKAAPDGYTLALVANGPLAGMPNLTKTSYTLDDIQFLTLAARIPALIATNSKSGLDSLNTVTTRAKAQPGRLSYSSSGNGTTPHIGMEIFKQQAKISLLHIPYRGAAPAITALLSGEVDLTMVDLLPALPHVSGGNIKALAIAGATRSPLLPGVPTTAELGLPGVTMETVYGVIAPKGLPAALTSQIHDVVAAAINSPEVQRWLQQQGAIVASSSAQEYYQAMRAESDKWKEIIARAHITLN